MDVPGWKFHPLSGDLADHWSVWVNGNWRLTFGFDGEDPILVDYQDYHYLATDAGDLRPLGNPP